MASALHQLASVGRLYGGFTKVGSATRSSRLWLRACASDAHASHSHGASVDGASTDHGAGELGRAIWGSLFRVLICRSLLASPVSTGNEPTSTFGAVGAGRELLDHRAIGMQQKLFMIDENSPGSAYFLPHGARIFNK